MMLPLEDVRILAFSQFGAGPFGMMQLADLGAEIIKIEDPDGGDSSRQVPPFTGEGDSLYFQSFNRNTRSLTLNLRCPEGVTVLHDLVRISDGVFSNLRGDQPDRLGLRYDQLKEINPRVVCCSLTGFGMTGPRRAEPGYDYLIQAYAGLMSMTGEPDGPPTRAGWSVVDFSAGLAAALGMVTGILAARRTGQGCDVDASLLDTAISMLNYLAIWNLNRDFEPQRLPDSSHPTLFPSQLFATKDGYIVIMCAKEKFWTALTERLERPEWAADPRFRTFADRYQHREALASLLKERFRDRTTGEWLARLSHAVPCAPVNSVGEALRDEQVLARDLVIEVDHPVWGPLRQTASAVRMGPAGRRHVAAPALGADTESILRDYLDYSARRVNDLRTLGAI